MHSQHVMHRDLKPSNVLFDDESRVRISDFGLSCSILLDKSLTQGLGTPTYMAPESFTQAD
jgi:serine/threonine protein kinase